MHRYCSGPKTHLQHAGLLFALLVMLPLRAAAVEPDWRIDFPARVAWQQITTLGDLLVGTANGAHAVAAESGRLRWSLPQLGDLRQASVEEIVGTPLVLIDDGRPDPRTTVLNMLNGAIVFDSRAENLTQIAARFILPHNGSLLIAGFETGNPTPTLFLYDIDDGQRRWASDALSAGMGGFLQLLVSAAIVLSDASPVQSAPVELHDGTFILGALGNLYRFDHDSGEVLWKTPFAGGRFKLVLPEQRPDTLYAGAESIDDQRATTQYQGFRLSDGAAMWNRPIRFGKPMNDLVIPTNDGLLISEGDSDKGRVRLIEYDSGESLWGRRGRGLEIKGQVVDYTFTDAGLLLTTGYDSIWTNRDTEYLVYVIDGVTGTPRFEEPLEVRGRMLTTELTDFGLLYVTTHEIDIFDPATGIKRNGGQLRSRAPLAWMRDGTVLYAYTPDAGLIYTLDLADGRVVPVSTAAIAFDAKDPALTMDLTAGKLVLIGRQTIAAVGSDGDVLYQTHYPAPRDPAWLRGLAWAAGIRAGMASAYAGVYSAAAASAAADSRNGTVEQQLAVGLQQGFSGLQRGYAGLAGDYIEFARRRYQASAQSRDFVFMMIRDEDRRLALAQVSKLDGEIIDAIDLARDKEPRYQVDDIANRIFYQPAASVIEAYSFTMPVGATAQAGP